MQYHESTYHLCQRQQQKQHSKLTLITGMHRVHISLGFPLSNVWIRKKYRENLATMQCHSTGSHISTILHTVYILRMFTHINLWWFVFSLFLHFRNVELTWWCVEMFTLKKRMFVTTPNYFSGSWGFQRIYHD